MSFSALSIRRPVLAAVASLLIVVFGIGAMTRIPIRELPNIDTAVVTVSTSYTGASPEIIDTDITEIVEGSVAGIAAPAGVVPVSGTNWYRTRMADRDCLASNLVSGLSSTFDGTDALLTGNTTAHSPPTNVAASAFGGNGAVSGPNFNSQWVRGATAALTSDLSHLPAGSTDQRGTIGSSAKTVLDSGIWTHAQMHQDAGGATNRIAVWSVDASLSVVESYGFALPASITDPCDPITVNTAVSEFRGYLSQGAFRGGTGMMAVGSDAAGRVLAAGNISELNITADPLSHIAVLRFNEDGTGAEWSLAGWAAPLSGKPSCCP